MEHLDWLESARGVRRAGWPGPAVSLSQHPAHESQVMSSPVPICIVTLYTCNYIRAERYVDYLLLSMFCNCSF